MKLPRRAFRVLLTAIPMSVLVAAAAVGHLGVPQVRGAEPIIDVLFVDGSPSGGPTGPTTTIVSPAEGVLQGNVSGYATRPGAAITFQVYPVDTVEDGDHWSLDFEAPPNEILVPGTYQATDDAYLATGLAYLRVSGDSTGCVATEASFTVIEASFDAAGAPTTFAASFMRSCGDTDPQRGEIRYHSTVGVRARDIVPTKITAPDTLVGLNSSPIPIDITNTGNLAIHPLAPGAEGPVDVSSDGCVGKALGPGATCRVNVAFVPSGADLQVGTITIRDDSYPGQHPILVRGHGIAPTTTTLVSTVNPSINPDAPTSLIATVEPMPDHGVVDFYVDGELRTTKGLGLGVATFGYSPFTGPHTIVAKFRGRPFWLPSESAPLVQEARRRPPIMIWASLVSAPTGHPVAVGADLRPTFPVSGGTLTLVDELTDQTLGIVQQPGVPILQCLVRPIAGIHRIRATYSGNGADLPNTATIDVVIGDAAPVVPGPPFGLGLTTGNVYCAELRTADGNMRVSNPNLDVIVQGTGPYAYSAVRLSNSTDVDPYGLLVKGQTFPYGSPIPWSLVDPVFGGTDADGERVINWQLQDVNGLWVPPGGTAFFLDRDAPVGSLTLAGGAAFTRTRSLAAGVGATDGGSPVSEVALSNDGVAWTTEPYAASVVWTLPDGDGTKKVWVKWRDAAGNWSATKTDEIVLDTVGPSTTAPTTRIENGTLPGTGSVPLTIAWVGADSTSGVGRYSLSASTDGGSWSSISTALTGESLAVTLAPGHSYRFRVRGTDEAGNVGSWTKGAAFTVWAHSEASSRVTYSGAWSFASSTTFLGGSARRTSIAGRAATYTFTGRSVAWLAATGPGYGKVTIFVDGVNAGTVDLYRKGAAARRLMFVRSWSSSGPHTIRLVNMGTPGHPMAIVDGFYSLDGVPTGVVRPVR